MPKGKRNVLFTLDEVRKQVFDLVGDEYTVIGPYTGNNKPLLMKHNVCGHEWNSCLAKIKAGRRCPKCRGGISYTEDQVREKIYELVGNEYSLIGKYKNMNTNTLMRHNVCGHEWKPKLSNFVSRETRCPECSKKSNISKGEKAVYDYLKENNYKFFFNDINTCFENCYSLRQKTKKHKIEKFYLPFDFYIPSLNLLIEFDGKQHFEPWNGKNTTKEYNIKKFKLVQENDEIKNEFAILNEFNIIRISYKEDIKEILDHYLPLVENGNKIQRLLCTS